MSKTISIFLFSLLSFTACKIQAGSSQTINIKDFGAKGNGISNDQLAFEKAANYINRRKGNTNLIIPSGTYIVGKQMKDPRGKKYLNGRSLLVLRNCQNVTIIGSANTKIRYKDNLKYGSFNPRNGQKHKSKMPFTDRRYSAQIGSAIFLQNCNNIQIKNLEVDGNSRNMIFGGGFGDKGIQLSHYGVQIITSTSVELDGCNFHHLALDGVKISNGGIKSDNIVMQNSKFNYNGRQGLSWVGGNGLQVTNCEFSFTGKGGISSSPSAGVDVEASHGNVVKNGKFINCKMIANAGCGLVADTGPSSDISFDGCTFWGVNFWSIWVDKPNYTFTDCNIYGSFVHGCITTNLQQATKFYTCRFEDKPYKGKGPYGRFLLECDKQKLMIFENCTFTSNLKKTIWYNGRSTEKSGKAIFKACNFNVRNLNLPNGDYYGVIRKARLDNTNFNYYYPKSKKYILGNKQNEKINVKASFKTK